jgi:8-oxo-dGTP pyrophosphatase MutT (NUDIX family)
MFGGSIEVTDATAKDAARRELDEELGLDVADEDVEEVWHGLDSQSRTRHGLETSRLVSLFRVMIGSTGDLTLREGGSIIEIAKDLDVLRRHESSMTALTYLALSGKLEAEKAA